jgi:hypothetical protein
MAGVPNSGVFPLGRPGEVLLMESAGLYNQNQLIVNVNTKVNNSVSLNGSTPMVSGRSRRIRTAGLGSTGPLLPTFIIVFPWPGPLPSSGAFA